MIKVSHGGFTDTGYSTTVVLVDANSADLLGSEDADPVLVLTKDGVEVAWFRSWDHAVKADNLMEYTDE